MKKEKTIDKQVLIMNPLRDPNLYKIASMFQEKCEHQKWSYVKNGMFLANDLDVLLGDTYFSCLLSEWHEELKVEKRPYQIVPDFTQAFGGIVGNSENFYTPFRRASTNQDYERKLLIFLYNVNVDADQSSKGILQFKKEADTPNEDACEFSDAPGQMTLFPAQFFYRSGVNKDENRCNLFRTTLHVGLSVSREEYERLFLKDYGPRTKRKRGVSA
jgi:hypothetical protein